MHQNHLVPGIAAIQHAKAPGILIFYEIIERMSVSDNGNKPLLEVKNLKTYFFTEDGVVKAVDGGLGTGRRVGMRKKRYLLIDHAADRYSGENYRR